MLQMLWKFIIVFGFLTGFGAASSAVQGMHKSPDNSRMSAPPCRLVWQRYWDAHSCTRQPHRCPRDARALRKMIATPCAE